jgi:hypothetical protein
VVAPGELAGIGYMPRATGILAGVQVEELLASAAGQELRSKPLKIGNGHFQLDTIKDWTGLAIEEIEHLVLGVVVRDGADAELTPPTHLVVRTRKPYDQSRVRVALKASRAREDRAPDGSKRTLYTASVRGLPMQLWLADDRTIVVGLFSNFELVPGKPHEGLRQLPTELREVIEKRLPTGTPAWIAGHSANWKKTWLPTLAETMKAVPLFARVDQVTTFAVWLLPSKPAKIAGAFRCIDEAAARKIEQTDLVPMQKDNAESFKFIRAGDWLDVQLTIGER